MKKSYRAIAHREIRTAGVRTAEAADEEIRRTCASSAAASSSPGAGMNTLVPLILVPAFRRVALVPDIQPRVGPANVRFSPRKIVQNIPSFTSSRRVLLLR